MPQYNSYRQKAKASKLVDFSRSCAIEQAAYCQGNSSAVPATIQGLSSCVPGNLPSGDAYTFTVNNSTCAAINTTTHATIDGRAWDANCSGPYNGNLICTLL